MVYIASDGPFSSPMPSSPGFHLGELYPSHDLSFQECPDAACRGDVVERPRQPDSRVRTGTYLGYGISAVALGDLGPDPAGNEGFGSWIRS